MRRLSVIVLFISIFMAATPLLAQPYDLIFPTEDCQDGVTKELRDLHSIERDLAIERLTREPNKVDAYIELGDLRRRQGKLVEAKRFYEMALKIQPQNYLANQGLMMTNYQLGDYEEAKRRIDIATQNYPNASMNQTEFNKYRQQLQQEARIGFSAYEDDRDLDEYMGYLELLFPGNEYRKLKGIFRYEKWQYKKQKEKQNIDAFSATMQYEFNANTNISASYNPEMLSDDETIHGYRVEGVTGTDNLKLAARVGKSAFKENLFTLKNRYEEKDIGISLFGDLHPRTRVVTNLTISDISDNNSKRRYEGELIHAIFKKKAPFLTTSLRCYQESYEQQMDINGNYLSYWAPSDLRGGEFTLSWERNVGTKFLWGLDAKYTLNEYRFDTVDSVRESGAGASIFFNYKVGEGEIFGSFGDKINNYYRERRLDLQGYFNF